mmetsp:Transcript_34557/g.45682  ORF Transcript_34557/g.45682 Transcript_34557/m.45682 type:complete len:175 (-) Transcript_34557:152-676(-)
MEEHFEVFDQIVRKPSLFRDFIEFQDGLKEYEYVNGDVAAEAGHVGLLQQQQEKNTRSGGMRFTYKAMDKAAKQGHLQVVEWLHNNRTEGCSTGAMDWAASNGHLHMVEWLQRNRTEGATVIAMTWAAEHNHIDVVKYLFFNRHEGCTQDCLYEQTKKHNLDLLPYLSVNPMLC